MSAYKEGATTVVGFEYDPAGRRSALRFGAGATSSVNYGYDDVGRLDSLARELAETAADDSRTFAYNPASQIVTRSSSNDAYAWNGALNVSRPYAVNGLNQYTGAGGATFDYDANGNLKSVAAGAQGTTSYVYDAENRLVSASGAWNATLAYDPLGRLWQIGSAAGTRRFVYDGDDLVEEYDGAGNRPRIYVHGPGADEPLVWYELTGGPVHRFYHADHQGSIVALADDYGNALAINGYDPWGIPNAGVPGNKGRFQYTGQQWIAELGLYYYKARIYSPAWGRFLQVDPIGYDGGINIYAYVGNDPVNEEDSTGKCPWCIGAGIGALQELAMQTLVEGKSLKEVDWVDVGISAAAGATGYGLINGARRVFKAEATIVQSQRKIERARSSSERAGGATRRQRTAAQVRRAQTAVAGAKDTIKRTLAATAAVAAVNAGTQLATPRLKPKPRPDEKNEKPLNP